MEVNMKKILLFLCVLMLLPLGTFASTGILINAPMVDIDNNKVTISGRLLNGAADTIVMLEVTNPGKSLANVSENPSALQKIDQVISEAGGIFSFEFPIYLEKNAESGIYNVYITSASSELSQQTSFYFATPNDRELVLARIKLVTTQQEMLDMLSAYTQMFSLSFPPYDNVTKAPLANHIINALITNPNLAETPGKFQNLVRELSVLEAYNQNKKGILIDENGEFLYPQIIKLTTLEESYGVTAYNIYNDLLTETGKKEVRTALFGKNYETLVDYHKEFVSQVILQGFNNVNIGGYSHIRSLLSQNANFVGLNITGYNNLSAQDKATIDSNLMALTPTSISDLQQKLNELINGLGNKTQNPSGGANGSGSSSSYQISGELPAPTPLPEYTEPSPSKYFNDMQGVLWALEAVDALAERGTIMGVGDGKFAPNDMVKREEFVTMIIRAFKLELSDGINDFSDVANNEWYVSYVVTAKKMGITFGKPDGTFGVGEPISREDGAVMAYRVAELLETKLAVGETKEFVDKEQISGYAAEAIDALSQAQVINGMPDGTFVPQGKVTRAQAAIIIYNLTK